MKWSVRKRITVAIAAMLGVPIVAVLAGVILLFAFIAAWFHAGAFYSGDGRYRTGVADAAFQVEFPQVDLSRMGHYRFEFTRLAPPMGYSVGLRCQQRQAGSAVVGMTLRNERGEIVFNHQRRLSEWTWRRNLAVIDGLSVDVPIDARTVRVENRGVGPDGGWGTHFTPRWSGRYTLTVDILEGDPGAGSSVVHPVIEGYTAAF